MHSGRRGSMIGLVVSTGVLAGLLAGSCGGGSSSPVANTPPPSATPAPTAAPTPTATPTPAPTPTPTPTPTPAPTPSPSPTPGVITINIVGMNGNRSYSPNPASVTVGQQVRWRNADSIAHTATQDGSGFDTGSIAPGATSAPITLSVAGTVNYHCSFHPSMVGSLNVAN
jgi:plastocyanin